MSGALCPWCDGEMMDNPDGKKRCKECHALFDVVVHKGGPGDQEKIELRGSPLDLYRRLAPKSPSLSQVGDDVVNRPRHYTSHPSGIECIQITEHMGFCLGNAVKYIWRADLKADAIEDLKKARWYIDRELAKRGA